MQQNFTINIPTIPSKRILFKIQNNKFKGFDAKEGRFKDNMSYLSSHFINSFPNLHPTETKKSNKEEQDSRMSTKMSNNHSVSLNRSREDYRMVVPENKRNLMLKYQEEYKNGLPRIERDYSLHKGYSFGRSNIRDILDEQVKNHNPEQDKRGGKTKITDNYYFNTEQSENDDQTEKIQLDKRRHEKLAKRNVVRRSAVFESEDRWKSLQREMGRKIKMGPGTYAVTEEKRKVQKKKERTTEQTMKLERVMELLEDTVNPEQAQSFPNKPQKGKEGLAAKRSSMFFEGNTDRFGQQILPINLPLNVPGPGSYNYEDSLQEKANKILVLEEQRKLLKEWYNN